MIYRKTKPGPIDYSRIRKIRGSFSQIEHRFINDRFIDVMETQEILLYFFLITVGDMKGISFYSSERISEILKISIPSIKKAREGLIKKGFIAYRDGVYQVLDIPGESGGKLERDIGIEKLGELLSRKEAQK